MQRKNLIAAVEQAARDRGLYFQIGYEYQMNEALGKTPALWLSHPETSKHEGTTEGVKTYAVRMFIIGMPDRQSAADPELVWAAMEAEAAKICEAIADAECVKSISDVEMAVAKSSVTNRGEISMSIKMKVQAPFTNPKN